ncbi:MAG: Gfo/Idh/MocA family oxidoreductase [Pseudomonadota bacterium]
MTAAIPLAVYGAGLVGLRHCALIEAHATAGLAAVIEPEPEAAERAAELGHPVFATPEDAAAAHPDIAGAVIATANATPGAVAEDAAGRGWALLVEKPLSGTLRDARRAAQAAEAAGVPLLVGHHRRQYASVAAARETLASGLLGRPIAADVIWSLRKPDDYYRYQWRVESGGGPVVINLVHDVDLLRFLLGDIAEVSALASSAQRRGALEDSAAVALRFENGCLATCLMSDAGLSPWGWEAATGENPDLHASGLDCLRIVGDEGALSLPSLTYWRHDGGGRGDWTKPLTPLELPCPRTAPLEAQLDHFIAVARDGAAPICGAAEGLASLAATLAIRESARTGAPVRPDPDELPPWEQATETAIADYAARPARERAAAPAAPRPQAPSEETSE